MKSKYRPEKYQVEEFSGCFIVYAPDGTMKEFCGQGYKSDKERANHYAKHSPE